MTQKERSRAYYLANREHIKARSRAYYHGNLEKAREARKDWRERNHEKCVARAREWARANPELRTAIVKRWQERNQQKRNAHVILNNAIQGGRVIPMPCQVCGEKGQAHHDDYSKPLDVLWLCPKHHAELHRKERVRHAVSQ